MRKLGVNIDAFEDFNSTAIKNPDCANTIKMIADLGFGATFSDITFGKKPEEVAELCSRYGIEYQFVHAPFKGINSIWLDSINGEEMLASIASCIDSCSNAGVPITIVHISSGFTPPPMSQIGKDRFKTLVEHAENKNIKIAFENLRVPRYLKWAMDTFKDTTSVGFCWDTGHENCFTDGVEHMSLYGDRLLCTHIHDNMRELGKDLHMIPFDGKIDFKKVASHLKSSNYKGPLMLEVFSKHEIYNNISEIEFFKRAYNAIAKIQSFITD